jgi:hypothetical protein
MPKKFLGRMFGSKNQKLIGEIAERLHEMEGQLKDMLAKHAAELEDRDNLIVHYKAIAHELRERLANHGERYDWPPAPELKSKRAARRPRT